MLLNNIPACFEAISLQSLDLFWGKASTLQNPPFFQTIQLKDLRAVAILSYCKTSLRENTCTIIKFLFWTLVFPQNAHEKKCLFCCCLWNQCTPQFAAPLEQKYIEQKLVLKGIEKQVELFSRIFAVSVCSVFNPLHDEKSVRTYSKNSLQ